jgi:hypothetical protein
MTAFQGLQRGRYIGPVWIGTHAQRIIIDANGFQDLTVDQARRLGEAALALADELQALSDPASPVEDYLPLKFQP